MRGNQRKRQKGLARKKAKRKAVIAARRAHTGTARGMFGANDLRMASRPPVYECLVPRSLFELGLGNRGERERGSGQAK